MNFHLKHRLRMCLCLACSFVIIFSAVSVNAEETITGLESKTSSLRGQLDQINEELVTISDEISSMQLQVTVTSAEAAKTQEALDIAQAEEDKQYNDMKTRIKYMYENGNIDLLTMMFSAKDMSDFLNKAEFIQNISEYDREMLDNLRQTRAEIDEQKKILDAQQSSLEKLKAELTERQNELTKKAADTSTDLVSLTAQLEKLRMEKARKEAAEAAAAKAESERAQNVGSPGKYPSGNGVLTKSKGVNYFNGFKETYYNLDMSGVYKQARALGLQGEDWIRADGVKMFGPYIVAATAWDVIPYGSTFECSLGKAISLDTGTFAYTNPYQVDIAVDW